MKKFLLSILISVAAFTASAQVMKVDISYNQEEVFVVLNDKLIGNNPEFLKINFDMGGDLIFFKKGYYSHRIKIDPEKPFSKISIDLVEKDFSSKAEEKRLLVPDTLLVSTIVTNMTDNDIKEQLDQNFIENNYFIGKSVELFPNAINEIKDSRYKIAIEIVDQKQVRAVYKAPLFMMGYIRIRWSLLDSKSNKVVFFKDTEGTYFVKIQKSKGMMVSKMMKEVMKGAIKEAQVKLLSDNEFKEIVKNN
ncbi:MAG: hypothetical protein JXA68_01160 [Ignavibacteriales bacterium]|nr:hypothetical protein [Ignavibacteriales bacterium]